MRFSSIKSMVVGYRDYRIGIDTFAITNFNSVVRTLSIQISLKLPKEYPKTIPQCFLNFLKLFYCLVQCFNSFVK